MAKSFIAQVGDGIVELINASHLAIATRQYFAEVDLTDLDRNPRVYVRSSEAEIPTTANATPTRGRRFFDLPYEVLLINSVDGHDITDIDAVVSLYEDIDQYVYKQGKGIPVEKEGSLAQWLSSSMNANVNSDELRQSNVVQISGQIVYRMFI
jgi:hypothetical protein